MLSDCRKSTQGCQQPGCWARQQAAQRA